MGGGRGGRRGGGGGGEDSITLTISGSPEDLETGFQLAHLLLTRPKIEPAAFEQFQNSTREMLQEAQRNPMMLGMQLAGAAPFPDTEHRAQPLTVAQVDALTLAAAQSRLNELILKSPIEVTIVGDLPRERALELATRYLGSLPQRERVSPDAYAALRKVARPAAPRRVERMVDSPTPQAFVFCGFYGADESNVGDTLALALAARILSTRMVKEVREEAQLVYSIGAGSRPATTYPGFGIFSAAAPTDPGKAAALVAKLKSMYAAFAQSGPTDEELEVARKQFTNTRSEEVRQPEFWSRRIDRATFRGVSFDDILSEPDRYLALTGPQVRDVFARYYSEPNSIVVVVSPAGDRPADMPPAAPQSPGVKPPQPSGAGR
jgi:predicted Zn-dependent peptidase